MFLSRSYLHGRHEHAVDHVNDAIRGWDIREDDLDTVIQEYFSVLNLDADILAEDGLGAHQFDYVCSHNLARYCMIEQDIRELLLVLGLEQAFDGAGRELSECIIGGGEYCEWSRTLEGGDKSGSL